MPSHKNLSIEFAKAIGILLVVYGHVARGLHASGMPINEHLFQLVDKIIYSFHMPLFFFISGLFFQGSLKSRGKKGLLFSKLDTIIYPYIIWSILQGGVELVLSRFTNSNVSPMEIFSLLWEPRAQFWFLYVLFLIFALATLVYRKNSRYITGSIFVIAFAARISIDYIPDFFPIGYISSYFVFFAFGVLAQRHIALIGRHVVPTFIVLSILFLGFQYLQHFILETVENQGLKTLVALVSILFVISLSELLTKWKKLTWLASVGTLSLHIYLMHIVIGSGTRIALQKFLHIDNIGIHLVLGCLVSTVVPILLVSRVKFIEKLYLFSPPAFLSIQKRAIKNNNTST